MDYEILKISSDYGLVYRSQCSKGKAMGYIDANFVGDFEKRRSITGYMFTLCNKKLMLQLIVALSLTIVEFIIVTKVVKEAI